MTTQIVQELPHNDEAERSVLGSVFLSNTALDDIRSAIGQDDFYRESHRYTFGAMCRLYESGQKIDVITLSDMLHMEGMLEAVGGPNWLARLSNEVPSAANVMHYVHVVDQHSKRRQFIARASEVLQGAYTCPDIDMFAAQASNALGSIGTTKEESNQYRADELAKVTLAHVDNVLRGDGTDGSVTSGFGDVDNLLLKFQPGKLYLLGGRPGMGKTALALNVFTHIAMEQPAAFCSLEMPATEVGLRMICSESKVNTRDLLNGRMGEDQWARFIKAAGDVSKCHAIVDDTAGLELSKFKAMARRWVHKDGVKMIFIDYLQLMKDTAGRHGTRELEVSEISKTLKELAKELHIPIMALVQLNRDVEKRSNKRPQNSDLRESGSLEQDADGIGFIYRDEVYNEESEDKGFAEWIWTKNRGGALGMVRLKFLAEFTRFEGLSPEDEESRSGSSSDGGQIPKIPYNSPR